MKTLTTAILLSLGLSAGAYAADIQSPLTRAQVQEALAQAKASGAYSFGELDYPAVQAQASHVTRAQVQQELDQARAAGLVTYGEEQYPPQAAVGHDSHLTRGEVRAELAQAKASGEYSFGDLDYPPQG